MGETAKSYGRNVQEKDTLLFAEKYLGLAKCGSQPKDQKGLLVWAEVKTRCRCCRRRDRRVVQRFASCNDECKEVGMCEVCLCVFIMADQDRELSELLPLCCGDKVEKKLSREQIVGELDADRIRHLVEMFHPSLGN